MRGVDTQPEVPLFFAGYVVHQRLGAWRAGELA